MHFAAVLPKVCQWLQFEQGHRFADQADCWPCGVPLQSRLCWNWRSVGAQTVPAYGMEYLERSWRVNENHHLAVTAMLNIDPGLTLEEVVCRVCHRSEAEKWTPEAGDKELEAVVRDTLLTGDQDKALKVAVFPPRLCGQRFVPCTMLSRGSSRLTSGRKQKECADQSRRRTSLAAVLF